ncbi:MAG TPA: hypothetical protein DD644_03325 [Halomonas sp.]|uniref:hypothetical protein n=1 Tax=Halomonadaceae TaxID=28256 RepID=UPI000E93BFAA|nr:MULTISPECIES: hypothetical protein [Halomonas]HBP40773.1 hypothetical protein [Halomonas sp.]HBS83001.1 hypothetical protein [Halomonas campaniensis]
MMRFSDEELHLYTEECNSRADELIGFAMEMFGPMTSDWVYDGVIFLEHPPHLHYWPESGTVQVALSHKAINDDAQRDFQLAHEVCHLLYPSVSLENPSEPATNVINEGISTYFSVLVVDAAYGEDISNAVLESLVNHSPRYLFALKQVMALLRADRDAVKKVREAQPMVNEITEGELRSLGLSLPEETYSALTEAF